MKIYHALLISIVVAIVPAVFLLEYIVETFGGLISNFVRMSFNIDAAGAIEKNWDLIG